MSCAVGSGGGAGFPRPEQGEGAEGPVPFDATATGDARRACLTRGGGDGSGGQGGGVEFGAGARTVWDRGMGGGRGEEMWCGAEGRGDAPGLGAPVTPRMALRDGGGGVRGGV